jgi:mono/diheme cytochrome c family protein
MKAILAKVASLALALGLVCAWTTPVFPQESAKKPALKRTVAKATPVDSGPIMFAEYCAVCHGPTGKGNGPAAAALKKPPANLTLLTQKNNGTFPQRRVEEVLRFGFDYPAHGNSEMPIWGPTFRALSADKEAVTLRIANLGEHLRSLQVK